MIKNLNEIVKEWAYRVDNGQPNPNKPAHLYHLSEILIEYKWPYQVIDELLQNLTEVDIIKNKKSGNVYTVQTHNSDTQDLVKKDASEDDIEKIDKDGEEPKKEKSIKNSQQKNKEVLDKISKEKNPEKKEALKAEYMVNQLDNMLRVSSIETGAGRYNMSREDVESYRKYLKTVMANPTNQPKKSIDKIKKERKRKYGEITDNDIDNFIEDLEGSSKSGSEKSDKYDPTIIADIKAKVRGKGTPGSSYTSSEAGAERYRNVIRAYLETGGISPITGKEVPFSECQLDHIVPLGNEGKDEPDNWMFMEERYNQYKNKKTDEDIRADLEKNSYLTDAEISAGEESITVNKALKAEDRAFWKDKFDKSRGSDNPREIGVSIGQIEKMTKQQLKSS